MKAIIGGVTEALKLVGKQPEFQKAQDVKTVNDDSTDLSVGEAFEIAVSLLDQVYEGLDREVPQQQEDPNLWSYRELFGKCWRLKNETNS